MTENERVRVIRKEKHLTLDQFGAAVGVSNAAVSQLEQGKNAMSKMMRKAICREFRVNEEWLRNGTEPMFLPEPSDELESIFDAHPGLTAESKVLIRTLLNLPDDQQKVLGAALSQFAANLEAKDKIEPDPSLETLTTMLASQHQTEDAPTDEPRAL